MGAKIHHTHDYDLYFKIAIFLGSIIALMLVAAILSPIYTPIERALTNSGLGWFWTILMWVYIIGGYMACIMLLRKTGLQSWLPTYLHVRFSLNTKVTPDEAKRLDYLFNGSLSGDWYPLNSIKRMEEKVRRETLFNFANKIATENGLQPRFTIIEKKH